MVAVQQIVSTSFRRAFVTASRRAPQFSFFKITKVKFSTVPRGHQHILEQHHRLSGPGMMEV
jgi:hypothetical protein